VALHGDTVLIVVHLSFRLEYDCDHKGEHADSYRTVSQVKPRPRPNRDEVCHITMPDALDQVSDRTPKDQSGAYDPEQSTLDFRKDQMAESERNDHRNDGQEFRIASKQPERCSCITRVLEPYLPFDHPPRVHVRRETQPIGHQPLERHVKHNKSEDHHPDRRKVCGYSITAHRRCHIQPPDVKTIMLSGASTLLRLHTTISEVGAPCWKPRNPSGIPLAILTFDDSRMFVQSEAAMAKSPPKPTMSPLRLVIAGGGTGGHVIPAVAVVEEIRRRDLPVELLWIGGSTGVESEIARANTIPFVPIQTGKLRRYVSVKTLTDAIRIPIGVVQAWRKLRAYRPDVIYGTGGAVSFPTVIAGSRMAPILTHEQTAQIGIANKLAARFADTFATSFEQTANLARARHHNVVVTGNPVRASIMHGSRSSGLDRFGFSATLPVIYVTGGARGASPLNMRLEALLPNLLHSAQVLHQAGPASANADLEKLRTAQGSWPVHLQHRYHVVEFIRDEIADVYAMATLVIARAGAGTVTELAHLGLPSILIPLPGTWGDEQRKNAAVLTNLGAAITLEQDDATAERLDDEIRKLIDNPDRLAAMSQAAASAVHPHAASNLLDELLKLADR